MSRTRAEEQGTRLGRSSLRRVTGRDGIEEGRTAVERRYPQGMEGRPRNPDDRGTNGQAHPRDPAEAAFDEAVDTEAAGGTDKAIRLYRTILRQRPDHVRARNNLGRILDSTGEHATAIEHFRAALEVEPGNSAVLANLGAALGNLGRYREAEIRLREAISIDPESTEAALNLGILHFRRGLYMRAEQELARVVARDDGLARGHLFRGKALNRLGRLDEALAALSRAATLDPEDPGTFHLMGILYDKKNLPREAQVMYRRARALAGNARSEPAAEGHAGNPLGHGG